MEDKQPNLLVQKLRQEEMMAIDALVSVSEQTKQELKQELLSLSDDVLIIRSLKLFWEETQKQLFKELDVYKESPETESPFPWHQWYTAIWNKLSFLEKKDFHDTIGITDNNEILFKKDDTAFSVVKKTDKDFKETSSRGSISWGWLIINNNGFVSYTDPYDARDGFSKYILRNIPWHTEQEKLDNASLLFGYENTDLYIACHTEYGFNYSRLHLCALNHRVSKEFGLWNEFTVSCLIETKK